MHTLKTINSKRKKTNIKRNSDGEVSIFAGLVKCADCGGGMIFNRKPLRSYTKEFFRCSTYTQKGKDACLAHSVDYDTIYQTVLAQRHAVLAVEDEQKLIDKILNDSEKFKSKNLERYERIIRESTNRIHEIDMMVQSLFEEKMSGTISDEMFKRMTAMYEVEQRNHLQDLEKLEYEVDECNRTTKNFTDWIERIKACISIETLTRTIAFELIDKIEISEEYDINSEKYIDVSIFYKFGLNRKSRSKK